MSNRWRRPEPVDHAPYYRRYIDRVDGDHLLDALRLEGERTQNLLREIPPDKAHHRYAPGKWSVNEVLCHLFDTERVFAYRALAFARGDRQSLPGFDENEYAVASAADGRTLDSLREEGAAVRHATIHLFAGMAEAALDRRGLANDVVGTPRAFGFTIAGHEVHHRAVLVERYL